MKQGVHPHYAENADDADFGPPDKRRNFQKSDSGKKKSIKVGQQVEVKYDDNIWYKGTLIEHKEQNDEWIAIFDIDGEKTSITFPDKMYTSFNSISHIISSSKSEHYSTDS